jgi:predicted anti-sigma-YlaC factor YlaD
MVRPVRTLPFASRVTADSCTVAPDCTLGVAGETVTDATGTGGAAVTVIAAEPFFPSLVAMMFAEPALTAVTTPLELTEAIPAFELDHETARPMRSLPFASRRMAVALAVCPTTSEDGLSVTDTVATGTGGGAITVKLLWPCTPSLVALITAVPGVAAEITPASETLAIAELELSQMIGLLARGAPFASLGVATACSVCPATSDGAGSAKETAATGLRTTSTEVPPDEHAVAPRARPATARIMVRIRTRPSR